MVCDIIDHEAANSIADNKESSYTAFTTVNPH